MNRTILVLGLTLASCASIDYATPPPSDWPALRVIESVDQKAVHDYCGMGIPLIYSIEGCTVVDFDRRTCTIYLADGATWVRTHERAHCAGYDHPSDDTLREHWRVWKARQ